MSGAGGHTLSAELCAPLLLLCWLCCWPDDASADSTSGKHSQRQSLSHVHESGGRRRSSDIFGRRLGSSAVSLHLPSTSGYKKPLSAHRSHEEIGNRRKYAPEPDNNDPETRYHSAPSVIDEVLHRRDWEKSTKDLYIPLKPELEQISNSSESPEAPHASPESSSIEAEAKSVEHIPRTCKKHHTNIKSSRGKKEKQSTDIKDDDATEASNFYIGDNNEEDDPPINNDLEKEDIHTKSIYKAKDAKQCINESIRSKERPRQPGLDELHQRSLGFCLDDVIEQLDRLESLDRSGAMHHTIESRISLHRHVYPPPSVEPVGYEGGACYLAEAGTLTELRARTACGGAAPPTAGGAAGEGGAAVLGALRARHASDGDILAPPHRPESGAFSESDLELELEGAEERPPPYDELQHFVRDHKETAI